MPIMIGGGEFIINGAERVVVSASCTARPASISSSRREADKDLHSCRIIPERGSWIEINVTKKDTLGVRIDQSGKFSAMTLLRAMDPAYSTDREHPPGVPPDREGEAARTQRCRAQLVGDLEDGVMPMIAAGDVIDPETGEVYLDGGEPFTNEKVDKIDRVARSTRCSSIAEPEGPDHPQLARTRTATDTHEEALLKIYQRLRPGNPPQLEKAKELFQEKFQDPNRYRLGKVGRFRINRKFDQDVPETEMTLRSVDFVNAIKYMLDLRAGKGDVDDIDHLGNRRLRTIDELAADELRKGFLKLRRTVQERMAIRDQQDMTPRTLINPKSVSAAIEYFFGRGELSQVVDQTNPLAQLTHERRLSALGPGGLNRKRAGFEVRDVHISHYGRICPIETPEGTNIGLISSPVDLRRRRRVRLPDHAVPQGQEQEADRRRGVAAGRRGVAGRRSPRPTRRPTATRSPHDRVIARFGGDFNCIPAEQVAVHRRLAEADGRRLGGPDPVPGARRRQPGAHGFEHAAAGGAAARHRAAARRDRPGEGRRPATRGMVVRAEEDGTVAYVDAERIKVEEKDKIVREYVLRKFAASTSAPA